VRQSLYLPWRQVVTSGALFTNDCHPDWIGPVGGVNVHPELPTLDDIGMHAVTTKWRA